MCEVSTAVKIHVVVFLVLWHFSLFVGTCCLKDPNTRLHGVKSWKRKTLSAWTY
jgi:hypothetical protein